MVAPGGADLGTAGVALQRMTTGMANQREFQAGIEAGHHALGNRAFLHWVGVVSAGRQAGLAVTQGHPGPLQLMPKKKKKQAGVPEGGQTTELVPAPACDIPVHACAGMTGGAESGKEWERNPGSVTVQPEASATLPKPLSGEGVVTGEKKKKKKSRVQVALNTLRGEGVEAFSSYVEEQISEADLLHKLADRIRRAEDLAGVKSEALAVVVAQVRLLDPEAGPVKPQAAGPGNGPIAEKAVVAQIKTSFSWRDTQLFRCCYAGAIGLFRSLIRNVDVDTGMANESGTLLIHAVYFGHANIVRELLSMRGIDVNLAAHPGATPLYVAVQQGHLGIVGLLLEARGINVNLALFDGATPLSVASQTGQTEIVKLLLADPYIDVDARRDSGSTAVFIAAQFGHSEVVELLINHGADCNLPFKENTSPLCIAAKHGNVQVVRLLLQVPGIQVNRATDSGASPLGIAVQRGHKEVVRLLLKKGASLTIASNKGASPLHLACLRGHAAIVWMLLHAGADMDAEMALPERYTPYSLAQLAQLGDHREVMSVLAAQRRCLTRQPPRPEGLSITEGPGQTPGATPPQAVAKEAEGKADALDQVEAGAGPLPPTPTRPGEAAPEAETPSHLAQAQDGLRQEVLSKLRDDNLEPLEGIRLLEAVNECTDLDGLCILYNRLAHIERHKERVRRRQWERLPVAVGPAAPPPPPVAPVYSLGGKSGLDTDAVEDEIKGHLDQKYHRFVSQAVNDMEFGRGKRTTGYAGLWHVSAGIAGVGSCSVFYYSNEKTGRIRIVGTGHHVGRAAYRLDHATAELGEAGRVLRIA